VLDTLHSEAYCDQPPGAVYQRLLQQGRYLCSVSTMHRLLRASEEGGERRPQRPAQHHAVPRLVARAPNEVWTWDIERHEALSDRAMVRDHRGSAVAAAGYKRRAA
jgi:putative transposase